MELNKEKKGKKDMTLPVVKKAEIFVGSDFISFVIETLNIKETMLAALLRITERTLANWKDKSENDLHKSRGKRLLALYEAILMAEKSGIPSGKMLSFLDMPFDETTDDSGSLLGFIVDEVENKALNALVKKQIADFLKK